MLLKFIVLDSPMDKLNQTFQEWQYVYNIYNMYIKIFPYLQCKIGLVLGSQTHLKSEVFRDTRWPSDYVILTRARMSAHEVT